MTPALRQRLETLAGPLFLLTAVLLFSANNSALAWLLGENTPWFTPCNILCASNTVGVGAFPLLFPKDLTRAKLRAVTRKEWGGMLVSSIAANVIGALLNVEGLAKTKSVALVAIMGRLEAVWFLLLSVRWLGARFNRWIAANTLLLLLGVILALVAPLWEGGQVTFNEGVLYLFLGGWGFVVSLFVMKALLTGVPVGIFALYRVIVGIVLYHALVLVQGGVTGVKYLYSRELWLAMAWYGPVFVLLGQFVWLKSLQLCAPGLISLLTSFMFVLNMVWAVLLLGRAPTHAELIGGSVILASIMSGLVEQQQWSRREEEERSASACMQERKGQEREEEGEEEERAREQDVAEMGAAEKVIGAGKRKCANCASRIQMPDKYV